MMDLNARNYKNHGIRFSDAYLQSLPPSMLWFSIEEQAKLADAITRRSVIHYRDPTHVVTDTSCPQIRITG